MSEFIVTWVTEVTAENPVDAAMAALREQRDPESEAVVFQVQPAERTRSHATMVDLLDHGIYHNTDQPYGLRRPAP